MAGFQRQDGSLEFWLRFLPHCSRGNENNNNNNDDKKQEKKKKRHAAQNKPVTIVSAQKVELQHMHCSKNPFVWRSCQKECSAVQWLVFQLCRRANAEEGWRSQFLALWSWHGQSRQTPKRPIGPYGSAGGCRGSEECIDSTMKVWLWFNP